MDSSPTQSAVWVDFWPIGLEPVAEQLGWLDPAELAWAQRLVRPASRVRYTAAHTGLRERLGRLLGMGPAEVRFDRGPHGKPRLAGAAFQFNLAHSGDWAALAVCRDGEIGVDLECLRSVRDGPGIAARYFAPEEHLAVAEAQCPDTKFLQVWTRKEAVVKLLGVGLLQPLTSFAVPTRERAGDWTQLPQPNALGLAACWIGSIEAPPHCVAAIASEREVKLLRLESL